MIRQPIDSRTEKKNEKKKSGLYLTCQLPMTVRTGSAIHRLWYLDRTQIRGGTKTGDIFLFTACCVKLKSLRMRFLKAKGQKSKRPRVGKLRSKLPRGKCPGGVRCCRLPPTRVNHLHSPSDMLYFVHFLLFSSSLYIHILYYMFLISLQIYTDHPF